MDTQLIYDILTAYGLEKAKILAAQKGYRNHTFPLIHGNSSLNLIVYKHEPEMLPRIKNTHYVANFLAERGYPARQTADPRILQMRGQNVVRYAALYNYLPGQTIPWEAYTMQHIKQLGAMMSDMHAVLEPLPQQDLPFVIDECRALLRRMEKYFADSGVHDALAGKLGLALLDTTNMRPALTEAIDLPAQALHMDFVRGNILFDGQGEDLKISGVLDFEKTAWGPVVFDIARTLAFLIVDCKYKDEAKVRKYFLHSGYNKRGRSRFTPTPLLEVLVNFFLLHDLYKFLRHNPYDSLPKNEHFMRTRDFLLRRQVLLQTTYLTPARASTRL